MSDTAVLIHALMSHTHVSSQIVSVRAECPSLLYIIVMDDTIHDKHQLTSIKGYTHLFSEVEAIG